MKKKVFALALAVAVLAIMVSGTLAYFTDDDEVTNTFTIGSVRIEIYENDHETTSDTMKFTDPLIPIVNVETPSADESYIPKVVEVKNTGANEAYIRVHIAQPFNLLGYLELDTDSTGWERAYATTSMTLDGQEYIVVTYDYLTAVAPGEFTPELLKGAYLAADVDLRQDSNGNLVFVKGDENSGFVAHKANGDGTYTSQTVNVLVYAQAIQAQGFTDAASALDSGFGTGTNPWQ